MSAIKKRPNNPHFKDGVDYSWHTMKDFNDLVKLFRDKFALSPNMKDAKQMHTVIINELMRKLKDKPLRCSRLEYTGSAYEGVKVSKGKDDDDLEFDIMVIIEGGRDLMKESSETPPGYVLLRPSESDESGMRFQKQQTDGYVSADKVASHFMGQLSACIDEIQAEKSKEADAPDELRHIKDNIVLRKHGPAIQMDVYRHSPNSTSSDGNRGKPFYSVDMVPTFEMVLEGGQKEYYVAKPVKGVDLADKPKMKFAWRRSFSLDEKDRLIDMDKNNTCRKAIFRMLKVIRNGECGLALLTSYHLKTVLLREVDERPTDEDWREDLIGRRLMDVISRLVSELGSETRVTRRPVAAAAATAAARGRGVRRRKRVKGDEAMRRVFHKGKMPHLFISDVDLLDGIDKKACACIYYRLKHLKNSRKQMEAILNQDSKPRRKKKPTKKTAEEKKKAATQLELDVEWNTKSFSEKLTILNSMFNGNVKFIPVSDHQYDDDDDNDDVDDDPSCLDSVDLDEGNNDYYSDTIEEMYDNTDIDFD